MRRWYHMKEWRVSGPRGLAPGDTQGRPIACHKCACPQWVSSATRSRHEFFTDTKIIGNSLTKRAKNNDQFLLFLLVMAIIIDVHKEAFQIHSRIDCDYHKKKDNSLSLSFQRRFFFLHKSKGIWKLYLRLRYKMIYIKWI